jgi:hypothetical protein
MDDIVTKGVQGSPVECRSNDDRGRVSLFSLPTGNNCMLLQLLRTAIKDALPSYFQCLLENASDLQLTSYRQP